MIRLVSDSVSGTGFVSASGGSGIEFPSGSPGRIRIEANENEFVGGASPQFSVGLPEAVPRVLRDDTTPELVMTSLGGRPIAEDPQARLRYPADVQLDEAGNARLVVEARNVPPASDVKVRIVRADGTAEPLSLNEAAKEVSLTLTKSNGEASTWEGDIDLRNGFSVLQAHAVFN